VSTNQGIQCSILASLKRSNQGEIRIFESHEVYWPPFIWFNSSAVRLSSFWY
jgi:hypothetical protein